MRTPYPPTLTAQQFKTRFSQISLSASDRKAARQLWYELGESFQSNRKDQEEVAWKLCCAPELIQQAIMRVAALRLFEPGLYRGDNPFE